MANYKDGKGYFGGQQIEVKPGQLITGLRDLSPDSDEDPYLNKVRGAVSYLEKTGRIQQTVHKQGRLITVCNWEKYQLTEIVENNALTNEPQTDHKPTTNEQQLSEEEKKGRKEEGRKRDACLFDFESVWKPFPKGAKQKAFKYFQKYIQTEAQYADLLKAVDNYLAECAATGRYLKDLSTFIGTDRSTHPWLEYIDREPVQLQLPKTKQQLASDYNQQMHEKILRGEV